MKLVACAWVFMFSLYAHCESTRLPAPGPHEYVGTTPCGELPREFLGIPRAKPCDKITWRLSVSPDTKTNSYKLIATFGLQEQSAPGFVDGGTTVVLAGGLEILPGTKSRPDALTYEIKSDKSDRSLSFVMVNTNLLQLSDRDKSLMVGNEFWSYTLNRKGVGRDR
jgi:hypothetical protein